jgi:hypothetical protein
VTKRLSLAGDPDCLRILALEPRDGLGHTVLLPLTPETLQNLEGRLQEMKSSGQIRSWFISDAETATFPELLGWLKSLRRIPAQTSRKTKGIS